MKITSFIFISLEGFHVDVLVAYDQERVSDAVVVDLVLAAMRAHPNSAVLQFEACSALSHYIGGLHPAADRVCYLDFRTL